MGLFNKIFNATTDGLVEANLEAYFLARKRISMEFIDVDGVMVPREFHAAMVTIEARYRLVGDHLGAAAFGSFFGKITQLISEKASAISERELILHLVTSCFGVDERHPTPEKARRLLDAFDRLLVSTATRHRTILSHGIDLSFATKMAPSVGVAA